MHTSAHPQQQHLQPQYPTAGGAVAAAGGGGHVGHMDRPAPVVVRPPVVNYVQRGAPTSSASSIIPFKVERMYSLHCSLVVSADPYRLVETPQASSFLV